jgi:signal transduction histidine kinase
MRFYSAAIVGLTADDSIDLCSGRQRHTNVPAVRGSFSTWTIRDHGEGFDVRSVEFSLRGHGLMGMRARSKVLAER